MKPTYLDAGKLAWYPDIACPVCGGDVNSWDKRCSRALGYRQIVCEGCISEEYQVTVENLRYVMENHFGLVPCPGIEKSTLGTTQSTRRIGKTKKSFAFISAFCRKTTSQQRASIPASNPNCIRFIRKSMLTPTIRPDIYFRRGLYL